MIRRQLDIEIFLGSSTEEVSASVKNFCEEKKLCPGNLVDSALYKHGNVYQFVVWYAKVVEDKPS